MAVVLGTNEFSSGCLSQERQAERKMSKPVKCFILMLVSKISTKLIKNFSKKCKKTLADSKKIPTFAIPFGKSQNEEGKTR